VAFAPNLGLYLHADLDVYYVQFELARLIYPALPVAQVQTRPEFPRFSIAFCVVVHNDAIRCDNEFITNRPAQTW